MAVRIDFYAVTGPVKLAGADDSDFDSPSAPLRPTGFVSASDADEELLFALFSDVAERSDLDAQTQGAGIVPAADLGELAAVLASADVGDADAAGKQLAVSWATAAAKAALAALSAGGDLAWRTRYDTAGAGDSGPEEWPTAW